jgi:hypothetical protein
MSAGHIRTEKLMKKRSSRRHVSCMQVILKILQGFTDGVWTIGLASQAMNRDLLPHHRWLWSFWGAITGHRIVLIAVPVMMYDIH